jgi:putative spermidine/putrescine transport system permease protein
MGSTRPDPAAAPPGHPARRGRLGDRLLLAVALAVMAFILAPLVVVVVHSFNSVPFAVFPPQGLSLRWYRKLADEPQFFRAFVTSVVTSGAATLLAVVIGVMAALALTRYRFKTRPALRAFYLSPIVAPKIVLGVAFFMLFLRMRIDGSLLALTLAHLVITLPFVVVIVSAALAGIDRTYEEAAMDLGARPLTVFFRIVLPQVKTAVIVSAAIAFVFSFDQLEASIFIVRPKTHTLPIEMFIYIEKWQDPTVAVVSAILIALAILLVTGVAWLARRREIAFSLTPAPLRPRR